MGRLRQRGRRHASTDVPRRELLVEVAELDSWLAEQAIAPRPQVDAGLDQRAELRRTRHVIGLVADVLAEHLVDETGRCRRCPHGVECVASEMARGWMGSWVGTGGLAERREGDPDAVSTKRLP